MDNTAQMGNQGDLGNKGTTSQPIQPTPISIPQKEQGPAINSTPEIIKPSGEVVLPQEVSEAGVEKTPEVQPLPPDAEKVGVKLAKEATPVVREPSGAVQLPKTEEAVKSEMKTQKNPSNSATWWLMLMWRQFKKMHKKLLGG